MEKTLEEIKSLEGGHIKGEVEKMAETMSPVEVTVEVIYGFNSLQSREVPVDGGSVREYLVTEEALRTLCPRAYATA